jgi:basic membrane lipoprotein Med (substrate-binding protein (PBP1-ABC) superfamily)
MNENSGREFFEQARKLGLKEYNRNISRGEIGYLPSLEGVVKNTEIVSHVDLGLIEIPLKKIIGTYTHLRSLSFAKNFMPLIEVGTEFEKKWSTLCEAHLNEGITHAIKVYEYMNFFYVIEGNKRVSVLKSFDAYSISANVIRLIPKKDDSNKDIRIYYEFLEFNKTTGINSIWFSSEGSFKILLEYLNGLDPNISDYHNKYKYFEVYIYNSFRDVYLKAGGEQLPITTGDAFLEYIKIYDLPQEINIDELSLRMKEFLKELSALNNSKTIDILTEPLENPQKRVLSTLTSLVMPKKKIRVAFAYARTIKDSGWTYAHELGRLHIEKVLREQISTTYVENVPEDERAYDVFEILAESGYDIIFTTSPIYFNATLKCSLAYPHVRFFNCSGANPYAHVSNYYGRTYEPRFLTGVIAGAMTQSNIIGYVGTSMNSEVISSINAFALGAKMVNPYAKVKVAWTNEWNSRLKFNDAGNKLIKSGSDIICNRTLDVPHPVSTDYGVYSMLCSIDKTRGIPDKYLATPIWNWGIFYEKIISNILNDTFRTIVDMFSSNSQLINFWWGIDTGVVDIFYSNEEVPPDTQKLVTLLRTMIATGAYHPFTGPILDQQGNIRINSNESASYEQILSMDWFVDNVIVEDYDN